MRRAEGACVLRLPRGQDNQHEKKEKKKRRAAARARKWKGPTTDNDVIGSHSRVKWAWPVAPCLCQTKAKQGSQRGGRAGTAALSVPFGIMAPSTAKPDAFPTEEFYDGLSRSL